MLGDILPWHWIVGGCVLIILEVFLASFFIMWFGIAAILVGIVNSLFPHILFPWLVALWALLTSTLAFLWFKLLKPLAVDQTKAGLSKESIVGQNGQVISVPAANGRGKIRFPAPILGSDEWPFLSENELVVGDRVTVVDVAGNTLVVSSIQKPNS